MGTIVKIQLRRDTATNWSTNDPVLAEGEPGYETDTGKLKFGDGVTQWSLLPYFDEGDKNFIFTQGVASTVWNVVHNLGKRPSPVIIDSAGTEIEGQINHISNNAFDVLLNAATTGSVYIN